MNSSNIVKIGTALKWRGVYDSDKKYYQENIVTMCGSVFRCRVLQTQAVPPAEFDKETGLMSFCNSDIWDVIVDMSQYYNYATECKNLAAETFNYIKSLESQYILQNEIFDARFNSHAERLTTVEVRSADNTARLEELGSSIKEVEADCESINSGIDTLERKISEQAAIIDNLKAQIEYILKNLCSCSKTPDDYWQNAFLWNNDKLWPNIWDNPNTSTAIVRSYNPETGAIEFNTELVKIATYHEPTQTLTFIEGKPAISLYEEETATIHI